MGRLILHIDMDSYFASVEQQANPFLRGRPVAVSRKPQDRTIAAAVSKEAKRYGLKSGMPTWEVHSLCPQIQFVPGDPAKYAYISERIFRLLKRFSPLMEVFSIDEAFLDITDVAPRHGGPEQLARRIKSTIRRELGDYITCSIGIAPSKVLAKIASESQKPDGLVIIPESHVREWLERTPVTAACGINEGTAWRLRFKGVRTLADLGRCDLGWLRRQFGIVGYYLHLIGHGKDPVPLNPNFQEVPRKGFGHSRVFSYPYPSFEEAKDVLYLLCYKTARRMRIKGYCGRVVHFYAGGLGRSVSRQRSLSFPISDEQEIYETCLSIAEELQVPESIRIIGVGVTKLYRREGMPLPLFRETRRRQELLNIMDKINGEWGDFTVYFAYLKPIKDRVSWKVASLGMHRDLDIGD
jgi:DNA polymerase-4